MSLRPIRAGFHADAALALCGRRMPRTYPNCLIDSATFCSPPALLTEQWHLAGHFFFDFDFFEF